MLLGAAGIWLAPVGRVIVRLFVQPLLARVWFWLPRPARGVLAGWWAGAAWREAGEDVRAVLEERAERARVRREERERLEEEERAAEGRRLERARRTAEERGQWGGTG